MESLKVNGVTIEKCPECATNHVVTFRTLSQALDHSVRYFNTTPDFFGAKSYDKSCPLVEKYIVINGKVYPNMINPPPPEKKQLIGGEWVDQFDPEYLKSLVVEDLKI